MYDDIGSYDLMGFDRDQIMIIMKWEADIAKITGDAMLMKATKLTRFKDALDLLMRLSVA